MYMYRKDTLTLKLTAKPNTYKHKQLSHPAIWHSRWKPLRRHCVARWGGRGGFTCANYKVKQILNDNCK